MGITDIKKELKKLDKENLIDIIADLYKKNKSAKEFLDFFVSPNEQELFLKYKEKVYEAFYPKRGGRYKISEGKKAISDFKKLEASNELVAEIMLFYTETAVEFTRDYGDINEAFYNSAVSVYSNALKLMNKENILEKFADRTKKIVDKTITFGWGFHDDLSFEYYTFYE